MRFRKTIRVSPEVFAVAARAYHYVSEVEHPIPDFVMLQNTKRRLRDAVAKLPYEDCKALHESGF